jgi:phosphoglycerate dehydrogenase-like enzyme
VSALVLYVPTPHLHREIDHDRIRAIRPDVEILTTDWEIDHEMRVLRDKHPFDAALRAREPALTPEQADAFGRAEVIWALDVPMDLPPRAPKLRWIQAIGSGLGQFVSSRLPEGNVTICNAAGVGAVPIAEWALARILQLLKNLPAHDESARQHAWVNTDARMLDGRTVAVVGLGAIGRAVAVRCRALGTKVLGTRRTWSPGATDPDVDEIFGTEHLHDVLSRSDIVVLAATGGQENENLFDARAFAAMRPGALFVNVARGWLVDEAALIDALKTGQLAGAATDVARTEPLPADDPLWDAPNLLISPHNSARGEGYGRRAFELFARNFERYVKGEPLLNVVDLTGAY